MKILGIDQALTETGWFSYDTATHAEESGTITPAKGQLPIDRLDVLDTRLRWLIDAQKPHVVTIEGYAYAGQGRARELGELGGILRLILVRSGLKVWEIPPGTLKKFVSGKGNADKSIMLLATFKHFGVEFSNHNISDAFGLCLMTCLLEKQASIRLPSRLNQRQNEALTACHLLVKSAVVTARNRSR